MPLIEGLVVTIHVCVLPDLYRSKDVAFVLITSHRFGFFAFIVIFWVLGPREPASEVFTTFSDYNGWGNVGLAVRPFLGENLELSIDIDVDDRRSCRAHVCVDRSGCCCPSGGGTEGCGICFAKGDGVVRADQLRRHLHDGHIFRLSD
jgi:hypothetical protein